MTYSTDFILETAPSALLETTGWRHARDSGIEPNMLTSEEACYGEVVLGIRLHDTILPKLISGELRVPDVEKILEDVGI